MTSATILSDNGVTSGSAGLKSGGGSDGTLLLQTTTAGGSATTAVTVDNAQNVGVGVTPSAWSTFKAIELPTGVALSSYTSGLAIGAMTTNAYNNGTNWVYKSTDTAELYDQRQSQHRWSIAASGTAGTAITFTQAMTLDGSGNLLLNTTNTSLTAGVGLKYINDASAPALGNVFNTAGVGTAYHLYNTNATNNGYRFYVHVNGGIYNYSGNNSNLSDERTKTNIEVSGSYLDKICAIPVKLFNYKNEPENEQRTLGVIAQDVEAVAPEFVNQNGWLDDVAEGEAPLKSIYTTDMMFALMKCIQEQQSLIQSLTDRLTALEGVAK